MAERRRVAGSFRDPSGFVFTRDGELYRHVDRSYASTYDRAVDAGLFETLWARGLLIRHDEVDATAAEPGAHRVLRPERVAFLSYPYEWSFSQLRDAALATLQVQRLAMDAGMSLKDASAFNVQFHHGRPVLIDTLSFEVLDAERPWAAYGQFCRHFLGPLALSAYVDARLLRLSQLHIDGVPLDLVAELIPGRTRLRAGLGLHLHLHARSQLRHEGKAIPAGGRSFGIRAFRGVIDSLEGAVSGLRPRNGRSVWNDYYDGDSYTARAAQHKRGIIAKLLADTGPDSVWDLGANTGEFGRLAAAAGANTICLEADPHCVDAAYRTAVEEAVTNILPLVCDLTNPAPALGWAHAERLSLLERGPAGMVMALALVHHMAIGNHVPLSDVAAFLAGIAPWAMVEFVPPDDPKAKLLIGSRGGVFGGYTQHGFETAFDLRFDLRARLEIDDSLRTIYLYRRR